MKLLQLHSLQGMKHLVLTISHGGEVGDNGGIQEPDVGEDDHAGPVPGPLLQAVQAGIVSLQASPQQLVGIAADLDGVIERGGAIFQQGYVAVGGGGGGGRGGGV